MQNKNWRIIGAVAIILVFGARMWFSLEQKKEREKQEQMFRDLSRMQSEQFRENYQANMDSINATLATDLSDQIKTLDSIGDKLKADQEAFEKKMKQ